MAGQPAHYWLLSCGHEQQVPAGVELSQRQREYKAATVPSIPTGARTCDECGAEATITGAHVVLEVQPATRVR